MAYILEQKAMVIIETSVFTRRVTALLPDDEYRKLQAVLVDRPDVGPVIPGGGGLRKIRWSASGHGKRGGAHYLLLGCGARSDFDAIHLRQK
jgi:hypothetical protein